jgi:hypothetical protein
MKSLIRLSMQGMLVLSTAAGLLSSCAVDPHRPPASHNEHFSEQEMRILGHRYEGMNGRR